MLYLNIRKVFHDFLDNHEYALPLSAVDTLDAKIAETLSLWGGEKTERLYAAAITHSNGDPYEFAGQLIDILEDALHAAPGIVDSRDNDEDDSAIIVGDDYDALAGAINNAICEYGAFTWKEIVPAVPTPWDARELDALELAMMARTIACESPISLEDSIRIVASFRRSVCDYGTPLMTQEAAYAICDLVDRDDTIVKTLLALDEKMLLERITEQARANMANTVEAIDFESN